MVALAFNTSVSNLNMGLLTPKFSSKQNKLPEKKTLDRMELSNTDLDNPLSVTVTPENAAVAATLAITTAVRKQGQEFDPQLLVSLIPDLTKAVENGNFIEPKHLKRATLKALKSLGIDVEPNIQDLIIDDVWESTTQMRDYLAYVGKELTDDMLQFSDLTLEGVKGFVDMTNKLLPHLGDGTGLVAKGFGEAFYNASTDMSKGFGQRVLGFGVLINGFGSGGGDFVRGLAPLLEKALV